MRPPPRPTMVKIKETAKIRGKSMTHDMQVPTLLYSIQEHWEMTVGYVAGERLSLNMIRNILKKHLYDRKIKRK